MTTRKDLQAQLNALNESHRFNEARLIGQIERTSALLSSRQQALREARIQHMKQSDALQRQINELMSKEIVTWNE